MSDSKRPKTLREQLMADLQPRTKRVRMDEEMPKGEVEKVAETSQEGEVGLSSIEKEPKTETSTKSPLSLVKKETPSDAEATVMAPSGEFDGTPFFALDKNARKRVSVSQFNGKTLVNLREWYSDKPSKKGITLNLEAFEAFKKLIPTLEAEIEKLK